jgi:hypothetical protein
MPSTSWAIYSRTFASSDLAGLSLDGSVNYWDLNFYDVNDDIFPPSPASEDIQIAWFALAITPPDGL